MNDPTRLELPARRYHRLVPIVAERPEKQHLGRSAGVAPAEESRAKDTGRVQDENVAIDAPAGPSEGYHLDDATVSAKFRPARCAEVALGRAGYWVSWVTGAGPHAAWVESGFAVYAALAHLSPLEVFPHAVFAELLGGRPPKKQTLAGRRARLSVLDLPPGGELWGHDGIDAAAACRVAIDHSRGRARAVGCDDHEGGSVMWLPA